MSQDATVGVAAIATAAGGPPDLVALDSGSDTLGILPGLGDGRFANAISLSTAGPALAVRVADFNGDGNSDMAILGENGLSIWLGNGTGGFRAVATYDVGPDPTGLSIAEFERRQDSRLDRRQCIRRCSCACGRGRWLLPDPGRCRPDCRPRSRPRHRHSRRDSSILVDQAHDQIVVQNGPQAQPSVLADRRNGLLVPGTPVLADLSGDGIADLIVPNSGGNNVLVYPGLPGGGFGPAMNGGNGFFTGTNPDSVVVADVNGDGRPDLIVANKGSNDVSILLNEPSGAGFTFVQGPRLQAGAGPVGLLYGDFSGDGIPDILVSDSASKQLTLLVGRGGGFYVDTNPPVFPLLREPRSDIRGTLRGQCRPRYRGARLGHR